MGAKQSHNNHSVGAASRVVTITAITPDGLTAICVDKKGFEVRVPMLMQRAKGPLPVAGEQWILTQEHGSWMFSILVASSATSFTNANYAALETGTLQVDSTSVFTGLATFNGGATLNGTANLAIANFSGLSTFSGEADFNGVVKIGGLPVSYLSAQYATGEIFVARSTTTTPTADATLTLNPLINAIYKFECVVQYAGGASGATNFRWTWGIPAGAELDYTAFYPNTSNVLVWESHVATDTMVAFTNGVSTQMPLVMHGTLYMGSTSGAVVLKWAQGTSSGTTTRVYSGSRLSLWQVG